MAPGFDATLFDYNGVLVDDEAVHLDAFREALAPLGVTVSDAAYFERYIGYDDRGAFRAILADAERAPTDAEVAELVDVKKPLYLARARRGLRVFAGAADAVRRRARAGPVVIVSGALRAEIELGLDVLGVAREVRAIVSAEDTRACKPDPEGYLLGVARVVGARRPLAIEDSVAGVTSAKRAGLTCVAVRHSHDESALRSAGADAVFPTIADVTEQALAEIERASPS